MKLKQKFIHIIIYILYNLCKILLTDALTFPDYPFMFVHCENLFVQTLKGKIFMVFT